MVPDLSGSDFDSEGIYTRPPDNEDSRAQTQVICGVFVYFALRSRLYVNLF